MRLVNNYSHLNGMRTRDCVYILISLDSYSSTVFFQVIDICLLPSGTVECFAHSVREHGSKIFSQIGKSKEKINVQ